MCNYILHPLIPIVFITASLSPRSLVPVPSVTYAIFPENMVKTYHEKNRGGRNRALGGNGARIRHWIIRFRRGRIWIGIG